MNEDNFRRIVGVWSDIPRLLRYERQEGVGMVYKTGWQFQQKHFSGGGCLEYSPAINDKGKGRGCRRPLV